MQNALTTAATGMAAQQFRIDTIANNLANANTPAFKGSGAVFQDLLYRATPAGSSAAAGVAVGTGAAASASARDLGQGALQETGKPTDLAIEGDGFFRVRRADGTAAYTRAGNFQLDGEGRLTSAGGDLLVPGISVPDGASEVVVSPEGRVSARLQDGTRAEVGRIVLVRFANPSGLAGAGDGLLVETEASGRARAVEPGAAGAGLLRQGFLEASNVSLTAEMTALIEAQRAFGILAKVVSAADEMQGMANSLRR